MMSITRSRADLLAVSLASVLTICGTAATALDLFLPVGAQDTFSNVSGEGEYDLPIGAWTPENGVPSASLTGEIRRTAWRIPGSGLTTGQVIGPIRDQFMSQSFDIIFECNARSCGGFDFRFEIEVLQAPDMYVDLLDYQFLSAKSADATNALSLLVSRDNETVFVQMIEVGPRGRSKVSVATTAPTPVPSDTGDVVGQLESQGHVVLNDLVFASGSASLGDGSLRSLDVIVGYLTANPSRQITFVGHTDATGSLAANVALSRKRAEAAEAYVTTRGVSKGQVAADGVGFLSPRTTNLTSKGREANRRVEAVLISVK